MIGSTEFPGKVGFADAHLSFAKVGHKDLKWMENG
jgi:hypothetical protein